MLKMQLGVRFALAGEANRDSTGTVLKTPQHHHEDSPAAIRDFFAFSFRYFLAGVVLLFCFSGLARASSDWPDKPITLIVPFGAGGVTDLTARTVAKVLQQELGQSVIVENRPGAGGSIVAGALARAKPDGYTLMIITNGMIAVNPLIHQSLNYDAFQDFDYVSMIANTPLVLVVPDKSPIGHLRDLLGHALREPDSMAFASSGIGTSIHQVLALLQHQTDTAFMHVPYKSGAEAVTAVLSGTVQVSAVETVVVNSFVESGKMRALGVTSSRRVGGMAGIPTVAELLDVDFDVGSISGLVAPRGTPAERLEKLEKAMERVLRSADMQNLYAQGSQAMEHGAIPFRQKMMEEASKWKAVFAPS